MAIKFRMLAGYCQGGECIHIYSFQDSVWAISFTFIVISTVVTPVERPLVTSIHWPASQDSSRSTSLERFTLLTKLNNRHHVYHPGPKTHGHCLCCFELLFVVHLRPPTIWPCLWRTRGREVFTPWLNVWCNKPSVTSSSVSTFSFCSYFAFLSMCVQTMLRHHQTQNFFTERNLTSEHVVSKRNDFSLSLQIYQKLFRYLVSIWAWPTPVFEETQSSNLFSY